MLLEEWTNVGEKDLSLEANWGQGGRTPMLLMKMDFK